MIWESGDWKSDLLKISKRLEQKNKQKRWGNATAVRFEKDVIMGSFIVRKLLDSNKISFDVEMKDIPLFYYSILENQNIDSLNFHRYGEKYDFGEKKKLSLSPRKICDYIIHSYVFAAVIEDNKSNVSGLLFNPERSKNKIYALNIENLISIFVNVATDDIQTFSQTRKVSKKNPMVSEFVPTEKKRGEYCEQISLYIHKEIV